MSPGETLAFWVVAPGRGELRPEAVPVPKAQEASVRTLFSGVSRGTEALVFNGAIPVSEYDRMRAPFQVGTFPGPVKYGYISVGEVTQGPEPLFGRTVFCLHPHQQQFVVPCDALFVLPGAVPPERAVLAANLETALNGLWDSGAAPGDRISIVGAGSVGCLVAWLAGKIPGCEVELVDPNEHRKGIAQALGVRFARPDAAALEADVVVHASGSTDGLTLALQVAGQEATITELSWFGNQQVQVPLGAAFHARRLTLRASQVGAIAPARRARWSLRRRMELALTLLEDPALDALINSEGRFEDLPQTLAQLARTPGNAIMHRVRYS